MKVEYTVDIRIYGTQTVPARKLVLAESRPKAGENVAKFSSEKRARQFAAKLHKTGRRLAQRGER